MVRNEYSDFIRTFEWYKRNLHFYHLSMQTVLVEIDSQKALNLLHELEELHILRIIKEDSPANKAKLSEKYRGVFSKEDAASFNEHTQIMRKEWDNT